MACEETRTEENLTEDSDRQIHIGMTYMTFIYTWMSYIVIDKCKYVKYKSCILILKVINSSQSCCASKSLVFYVISSFYVVSNTLLKKWAEMYNVI